MSEFTICPSCGVLWIDHLGLVGTCAKLQEALDALRSVRSRLSVGGHDPEIVQMVVDKIDRTLEGLK